VDGRAAPLDVRSLWGVSSSGGGWDG
jgi:hypothetical protein